VKDLLSALADHPVVAFVLGLFIPEAIEQLTHLVKR
jgi:hypothetical protein